MKGNYTMSSKFKFSLIFPAIVMLVTSANLLAMNSVQQDFAELQQQALDQTDEINLIIELLEVAASNGKFNTPNEKDSLPKFGKIRKVISSVMDSDNIPTILGINELMIRSLEFMTGNNFTTIPTINTDSPIVRRASKQLSAREAQEKLQANKKKLETIQKRFANIGLSQLNIIARKSEKFIKKFKIHKTFYRIAPYTLILLYMAYVTRLDEVKSITTYMPNALATVINNIKRFIGTAPYIKPGDGDAPEVQDRNQFEAGQMSEIHTILQTGNFLKIEIEPIVKWAPATFLLGLVTKDWKDLTSFIKKKFKYLSSKLKRETIEEDTIFSKPTLNPEGLDLFEVPEFKNIKNYFKYKKLFDLADHPIDKSYLFIGAPATGDVMVEIFAAQIAGELNTDCRIVRLHASDFVPPKETENSTFDKEDMLSKVLTDAKKHDICFVIINDIDWIYKQRERTKARLDKFLDDISKKTKVIMIALTDNSNKARALGETRFTKLQMDDLNYEQRIKFIKAQLRADHARQDMGVEEIAQQTENWSLSDLKKIIQNAYTLAYTEHKPLSKKQLIASMRHITKKLK